MVIFKRSILLIFYQINVTQYSFALKMLDIIFDQLEIFALYRQFSSTVCYGILQKCSFFNSLCENIS